MCVQDNLVSGQFYHFFVLFMYLLGHLFCRAKIPRPHQDFQNNMWIIKRVPYVSVQIRCSSLTNTGCPVYIDSATKFVNFQKYLFNPPIDYLDPFK